MGETIRSIVTLCFILACIPSNAQHQVQSALPTTAKAFGQLPVCGAPSPSPALRRYQLEVVRRQAISRNTGTTCIPIHPIIVRQSAGTGGISLADIHTGISYLNAFFLDANIEFFICSSGVTYVDSDTYYDFDDTEEAALAAAAPERSDAVNVFFVNSITVSANPNVGGYAYLPFDAAYANRILMRNSATTSSANGTFVHEFGHYFGLLHTHEGTENGNTDLNAERVVRSGITANCSTNGDALCDTDADPNYNSSYFNSGTCTYTGSQTDDLGTTYTPPVSNIMSYFPDACGGLFTAGQLTVIQQGLTTRQGHSSYNYSCSAAAVSNPSALSTSTSSLGRVQLSWTDNASNETGYLLERSTSSASSGFAPVSGGATGANTTAYEDNTVSSNTKYYYRVKAANDGCNDYSNVDSITTGLVHCIPTHQSNAACDATPVYINSFTLNSSPAISNLNTGCSTDGNAPPINYANYVSSLTAGGLEIGSSYNFTFAGSNAGYVGIWIDLNQDGEFTACERMYQNTTQWSNTNSGSFTIPLGTSTGSTVLRVRCSNQTQLDSACEYSFFGETEDYPVSIAEPTCTVPTAVPSAIGVYTADASCTDGSGWTHFWKTGTPDLLLLSIKNVAAQGMVLDPGDVKVELTSGYGFDGHNLSSAGYASNPSGWYVMGRYFDVDPCQEPSGTVNVRFYFTDTDVQDIEDAISGTITGPTQLRMYKLADSSLDPNPTSADHTNAQPEDYIEFEHTGTAGLDTWAYTDQGTYHQAEYQVNSFSGGGGGSGGGGNNTGADSQLPVYDLTFTGEALPGAIRLNWSLSGEFEGNFRISRTMANGSPKLLTQMPGQVQSSSPVHFQFIDTDAGLGQRQYRLSLLDIDGRMQAESAIEIVALSQADIRLSPNPIIDHFEIDLGHDAQEAGHITLFDLRGRVVFYQAWPAGTVHVKSASLKHLPDGLYGYNITGTNPPVQGKLLKQKP